MRMYLHQVDTDLLIVEASEAINDDQSESIIDALESEIMAGKHSKIIVDCSQVQFLSSFGLSLIMRLNNASKKSKSDLKLAGINSLMHEVLRATRLTQTFLLYPDVEAARGAFHLRR